MDSITVSIDQPVLQRMAQNTAAHRPRWNFISKRSFRRVKRQHSQTAIKMVTAVRASGHSNSGWGYACRCGSRGLEWVGNGTQRFSGFPTFSFVKPKDGKQMRHSRSHKKGVRGLDPHTQLQ